MTTPDLPGDAAERAWAEFGRLFPNTMWPWEDLSADERDRWRKVVAQGATAGPRWHCTRDHVTVPCGECDPCRRDHADAFLAGREAERERIAVHLSAKRDSYRATAEMLAHQENEMRLEYHAIADTFDDVLKFLRQDGDTP